MASGPTIWTRTKAALNTDFTVLFVSAEVSKAAVKQVIVDIQNKLPLEFPQFDSLTELSAVWDFAISLN